jgi:prephenate dehydrogenase
MGELFAEASILFTISRVKADVDNGAPPCMKRAKSTVARPSVKLFSSASSISKAASFQPRCSSIITPTEKNTPEAIQWAKDLAEVLGFHHICTLTMQEHDKMIGYVSQLCHAIAVSLMCANDNSSLCEYTGDSFRDLTRIARINDKMWAELFLWNKQNLISEIDQFDSALQEMRAALVADDRDKLEQMFRLSTQRRAAFDKKLPE